MEEIDLLAESIIKLEKVKEEPVDKEEDYCWNSIESEPLFAVIVQPTEKQEGDCIEETKAKDEPSALLHLVKEDDEELDPPLAVFVQPMEKQGGACIEETKDPLAACCESASVATIKPEIVSSSPGVEDDTVDHLVDSKTQIRQGNCSALSCNTREYMTLGKRRVRGRESLVRDEHSENGSQLPKTNTATRVEEQSVCGTSWSESGSEVGNEQKEEVGNEHQSFKRRHMWIQSADRFYQCDHCLKSFRNRDNLVKHMGIHSGQRPHKCSVCGKSFTQSSSLINHMRIHSGERPYECSVCQKSFTERSTLVCMRIHSVSTAVSGLINVPFVENVSFGAVV